MPLLRKKGQMPAEFERSSTHAAGRSARNLLIVFGVVLAASLFGILTRPVGFLAAIWPANAILIGIMARHPALSTPLGWVAAFWGYIAADMMTGGDLGVTVWLTFANMAGAGTAYLLLMRLRRADRQLRHPSSVVYLFVICVIAAAVAAFVGGGAALMLFDRDPVTGFAFWFTTELVNMIIVLPAILTSPAIGAEASLLPRLHGRPLRHWVPALVLAASSLGALLIGGPGAFAYPVPALLWCALSYNLFATSLLVLAFSVVQMVGLSIGLLSVPSDGDQLMMSVSIRLAIALIALGPLAVASINTARENLVERLRHIATHDGLTGALTRGAFLDLARRRLEGAGEQPQVAVLMLDVDRFKSFNDRFGHAIGDKVLVEASQAIASCLRQEDLFGRLGGEEFAILLTGVPACGAFEAAERIRRRVEQLSFEAGREKLRITISIGLASPATATPSFDQLLTAADKAVYEAKAAGRNRTVIAGAGATGKRKQRAA